MSIQYSRIEVSELFSACRQRDIYVNAQHNEKETEAYWYDVHPYTLSSVNNSFYVGGPRTQRKTRCDRKSLICPLIGNVIYVDKSCSRCTIPFAMCV